MKSQKIKKIALIVFLLLLMSILLFLVLELLGKKAMLGGKNSQGELTAPEMEGLLLENGGNVVFYKGEKYLYNKDITSILCMGVDKERMQENSDLIGQSGQADVLMLAILDTKKGTVNLWNISRDSMTEVDIFNVDGEFVRTEVMQACLAFAYGDGSHQSCDNTVRAVSRLVYGMPIQSYAVIDMDVIQPLNDAVGGVEVTIHEEDVLPPRFKPGTKVLLKGNDVEDYIRTRMEIWDEIGTLDSNNNRMARQKQYMTKFIQKALQMTKQDISTPITLFNIARKDNHMITNLNVSRVAYLTTIFSKINFTENSFQTIPGEVVAGEVHAEYYVDDEVLYQMILDTFYIKQ